MINPYSFSSSWIANDMYRYNSFVVGVFVAHALSCFVDESFVDVFGAGLNVGTTFVKLARGLDSS